MDFLIKLTKINKVFEIIEIYLMYTVFSVKSLAREGKRVYKILKLGNLKVAREKLSYLVSRDTEKMDKFENDIKKLYPWKNLTELEYSNSPEYYKYRMYIYSPENKEEFMAYLIVYDTINGEWKRFYSKDFWNKNDENDAGMIEIMEEVGAKTTDDIAY